MSDFNPNPVTGLVVFLAQNQVDVDSFRGTGKEFGIELPSRRYEEGVVGVPTPVGLTQLFYADNGRVIDVDAYKRTAQKAATETGSSIEMVSFTFRQHIDWINP